MTPPITSLGLRSCNGAYGTSMFASNHYLNWVIVMTARLIWWALWHNRTITHLAKSSISVRIREGPLSIGSMYFIFHWWLVILRSKFQLRSSHDILILIWSIRATTRVAHETSRGGNIPFFTEPSPRGVFWYGNLPLLTLSRVYSHARHTSFAKFCSIFIVIFFYTNFFLLKCDSSKHHYRDMFLAVNKI